ncbi:MAG: hypothetical protein A3D35_03685 [Candidatus Staskawiczbacteria bacterium RIFCSPHIGHO2_02_FULL_34_9]|uniref:Uncharacterized protein n=1 Tax=Candidatus Staskawiczbacteria bacterium RIFCSPHIGHO2_02_FULL_34_9 TaxID=1802206 RepID=A0A1G2HZT8_9BACT|nr:MAG: hypothetical protein A3D35_03685 [Candidatus Staskawiczbacteria bacterium RIFCSPHIGHO2_02_FULL_34_9]
MKPKGQNIISSWLTWHFYEMPQFLFFIWRNYLWFSSNFFSIPLLLATLISPWRRYYWRYPKRFDVGEFFSSLISNAFSRLLGFLIRLFLIVFGILCQLIVFIVGLLAIVLWVLVPFILIFFLLFILLY